MGSAVIKLGGAQLMDEEALDRLFTVLKRFLEEGGGAVLVHGGGPQATALARALGQTPRKVAGRRITDEATLEVVKMAYAGTLQTDLVARARRAGLAAVGLSGVDARLVEAVRRPPLEIEGEMVDFGLVGEIVAVRPVLLELLVREGYLPILSPLAGSDAGAVYNINADTLAAEVAAAWKADRLVFLLEAGGVLRDLERPESRLPELTEAAAAEGIRAGWIHTGMRPKLTAGFHALREGVPEVAIVHPDALEDYLRGEAAGTRLRL